MKNDSTVASDKRVAILTQVFIVFAIAAIIFGIVDSIEGINSGDGLKQIKGWIPLILVGITFGKDIFYKKTVYAIAVVFFVLLCTAMGFLIAGNAGDPKRWLQAIVAFAFWTVFIYFAFVFAKDSDIHENDPGKNIGKAKEVENILELAEKRAKDKIRKFLSYIP